MDSFQPFGSFIDSTEFSSQEDDVLRILKFSDPNYNQSLALPALPNDDANMEFSDIMHFWDFHDEQLTNEQFAPVEQGCGNFEALPPIDHEFPAASTPQVPWSTIDCSGCQVLREVVHSNGSQNMKHSIHGGPDTFYHATLDAYYNVDGFPLWSNLTLKAENGNMQFKDLVDYFHFSIADAAKELGICTTALKKICRNHGRHRRPRRKNLVLEKRKIESIDKRISALQRCLHTEAGGARTYVET